MTDKKNVETCGCIYGSKKLTWKEAGGIAVRVSAIAICKCLCEASSGSRACSVFGFTCRATVDSIGCRLSVRSAVLYRGVRARYFLSVCHFMSVYTYGYSV